METTDQGITVLLFLLAAAAPYAVVVCLALMLRYNIELRFTKQPKQDGSDPDQGRNL